MIFQKCLVYLAWIDITNCILGVKISKDFVILSGFQYKLQSSKKASENGIFIQKTVFLKQILIF